MTSAVAIDSASAEKIARQLGEQGKPLPEAMRSNPKLRAAYTAAGGTLPNSSSGQPAASSPPPAAKPAPARSGKQSAQTRPAARSRRRRGWFTRSVSPSAALGRAAGSRPVRTVTRGGDAGGLLLALVIYPMVLATVRYGADGPRAWFRAKWLNETTGAPKATPTTPTAPTPPTVLLPTGRNRHRILDRPPAGHTYPGNPAGPPVHHHRKRRQH